MKVRRSIKAISLVLAIATLGRAAPPELHSGDVTLGWVGDDAKGYRPYLAVDDIRCEAPSAAVVLLLGPAGDDTSKRIDATAKSVRLIDGRIAATSTVTGDHGTSVEIADQWTADVDGFVLKRTVHVLNAGNDRAFGTGFEIAADATLLGLPDADVLVPGMWYGSEANTPPSSLIHDVGQTDFLLREDRMALPLVSLRDHANGWTITLTHEQPDGATIAGDDNINRVIDARLQFGSLGLRRAPNAPLRVAFRFPGTEGEQTSIFGFKPDRRTAERLHPMSAGATQTYQLRLRLSRAADFPTQMRDAWRSAYTHAAPTTVPVDVAAVYSASVGVLSHYTFDRGKVTGIPFAVSLPDGAVRDHSLQMGFVGQQLPCASYLIDEGLRSHRDALVAQGEKIANFWARESRSPAGVPRTWYDVDPTPHWRDYHTFLRVAADGVGGLLRAWQLERAAGRNRPAWNAFCRATGDWLLKIQNADGSFNREWTFDGRPASESKTSTLHPVRFLIELSCATGERKYLDAAVRAANYDLDHNKDGRTYVGGTPDNPDVIDKEAGWIAMDSYLALYDVTHEQRWLDAAVAAATFTETWVYGWNVPLPIDARPDRIQIPRLATTAGMSLIATGHSGSDLFMAYASLAYLRLAIYTGDAHFADVAQLLQANTAQLVDVGGSLGYAQPGLCVEAFSLAVNRGHSVKVWLPWCTSAILEPLVRTREIFGVADVAAVLAMPKEQREQKNAAWAAKRGYGS